MKDRPRLTALTVIAALIIIAFVASGCIPQGGGATPPKDYCQLNGFCSGPPPVCRPFDQARGRCNVS